MRSYDLIGKLTMPDKQTPLWCDFCKKYIENSKICPHCNRTLIQEYPLYKKENIPQYPQKIPKKPKEKLK